MANETAGSPVIQLHWAGKQIRIEEVDTFFSSLWRISVDNMRTAANLNVRTSVLNLVICVPDTESARYVNKILRDLSSTHLARATIVVLNSDATAPDTLESWATLRCFSMISDVMRHCFEQTTILTSGKATRTLPATLPGVLRAHLPVYLWWVGDIKGTDESIFRKVAEMSERIIVDSATFSQPERDLQTLVNYCKTAPEVAISDLNWGRLTPWRQLLVQFFDIPAYLPFLAGIEKIEVEHATAPLNASRQSVQAQGEGSPNPNSALLLAGWLNTRLNLALAEQGRQEHDTVHGSYQWLLQSLTGPRQALTHIQPHTHVDLPPGSIFLVRLTCQAEGKRAIFTLQRDGNTDYVLTSVEADQDTRPARTVQLPTRHKASELLRNELEIMEHDQPFEQALQEVGKLLAGE